MAKKKTLTRDVVQNIFNMEETDLKGEVLPDPAVCSAMIRNIKEITRKNYSHSFDPYGVQSSASFVDMTYKAQDYLFKQLMAKARRFNICFVSIHPNHLISPRIKDAETFAEMFAWEVNTFFDFNGGCGNGRGDLGAQYQIRPEYFDERHHGIWNPVTEERFYEVPFDLDTRGATIDKLIRAWEAGKVTTPQNVFDLIDVDVKQAQALKASLKRRY